MTDTRGQLLVAALVLLLGACAIANTPQQDLAYARWAKCNSSFPVVLERVDLDGRITFWLSNGRSQEVLQCLVAAKPHGAIASRASGRLPTEGCLTLRATQRAAWEALRKAEGLTPPENRRLV